MSRGWNGWLATLLDAPGESVNERDGEGGGWMTAMLVPWGWMEDNEEKRRRTRCCNEISRGRCRSAPRKKAPACAKKDTIFACVYFRRNINSPCGGKKDVRDSEASSLKRFNHRKIKRYSRD